MIASQPVAVAVAVAVTVHGCEINTYQLLDANSLGYCREVFDLFDEKALSKAAQNYLAAYLPPSVTPSRLTQGNEAPRWRLIADEAMEMFPYLHHALYGRS